MATVLPGFTIDDASANLAPDAAIDPRSLAEQAAAAGIRLVSVVFIGDLSWMLSVPRRPVVFRRHHRVHGGRRAVRTRRARTTASAAGADDPEPPAALSHTRATRSP